MTMLFSKKKPAVAVAGASGGAKRLDCGGFSAAFHSRNARHEIQLLARNESGAEAAAVQTLARVLRASCDQTPVSFGRQEVDV